MYRSHCYRKHKKEFTETRRDTVTVDSMTEQDMDTNDEPSDEPKMENAEHHTKADRQQKQLLF